MSTLTRLDAPQVLRASYDEETESLRVTIAAAEVELQNNQFLKSRNAADDGDVNLIRANTTDQVQVADFIMPTSVGDATQVMVEGIPASYIPTLSDDTGVDTSSFIWHREGHHLYIDGQIVYDGAGAATDLTFTLPTAVADDPIIDTTHLPGGASTANATASLVGDAQWFQSGIGWRILYPRFVSTTTIGFVNNTQAFQNSLAAAGDSINFRIKLPIVGWGE
jgi:hypothetical protein